METRRVADAIAFSPEKMAKNSLYDSPHMYYDVYCLLPGQAQKVHAHDDSDKVYYVLDGVGRFTIGDEEADQPAGTAVMARSGIPHGVRNASEAKLTVLVTMAPKP
jgi:mannose-6-phosphate isomerase-like protein (cupin superfamily)